jgi:hypothetical protein
LVAWHSKFREAILLSPGGQAKQLQRWYNTLSPVVESAWERLREVEPEQLARRSGCTLDAGGALRLAYFRRAYRVDLSTSAIQEIGQAEGRAPSDFVQALLLTYLVTADGTPPSARWIAYRDLPGGMFYAQAFHGYAEARLVRDLEACAEGGRAVEAFCRGADRLGGEAIALGNAGYAFQVLPRIRLAAVYWLGDEDFPSQASILFEETAPHYMSTDGLAVLGSHLVSEIVSLAGQGVRVSARPEV